MAGGTRLQVALLAGVVLAVGPTAGAGPWSSLPDAVARLQRRPDDPAALAGVGAAESSLLAEAKAGHLGAVAALMEAYQDLVTPLSDGDARCARLRARTAAALADFASSKARTDPVEAGRSLTLAAVLWPDAEVEVRLRSLLLPPVAPEPGHVWASVQDGAELVFHPPMQFDMGCGSSDADCQRDELGHWVETQPFWMERNEVTNRRYRACVDAGACSPPHSSTFDDPAHAGEPVVGVTWTQAAAYAAWTGRRLPSEAEWERAARSADAAGRFPWGRGRDRGLANLYGRGDADRFDGLAPVASFPATGLGVYDLAGNVWEWCQDRYHRNLGGGPTDGHAWVGGNLGRVVRGGSWRRTLELARVSSRGWYEEDYSADDVGFRCVLDVPQAIPSQQLVAMARNTFPLPSRPGFELAESDLSAADRQYLERMTLTWFVLEGRVADALPRAVAVLRRNPADPVALDLLSVIEKEMAADVERGDLHEARAALLGYRTAVSGDRRLQRRLADQEQRLLAEMRLTIQSLISRGELEHARAGLQLAKLLDAGETLFAQLRAAAEPRPGEVRVWAADGKQMVWVPPSSFHMGALPGDGGAAYDEHPAHAVTTDGFWIDRTEVTNDEYRRCVEADACSPPARTTYFDDPNLGGLPVAWVSWFDARSYALWAGKRLPSEAEWERVARGTTATRFPWGDDWLDGRVNGLGVVAQDRWDGPAPVGSFPATSWGIEDLLGNVAEWVSDAYHRTYWEAPGDGRSWVQLTGGPVEPRRVVRGGSFMSPPMRLRISERDERDPASPNRAVGFRCVSDR